MMAGPGNTSDEEEKDPCVGEIPAQKSHKGEEEDENHTETGRMKKKLNDEIMLQKLLYVTNPDEYKNVKSDGSCKKSKKIEGSGNTSDEDEKDPCVKDIPAQKSHKDEKDDFSTDGSNRYFEIESHADTDQLKKQNHEMVLQILLYYTNSLLYEKQKSPGSCKKIKPVLNTRDYKQDYIQKSPQYILYQEWLRTNKFEKNVQGSQNIYNIVIQKPINTDISNKNFSRTDDWNIRLMSIKKKFENITRRSEPIKIHHPEKQSTLSDEDFKDPCGDLPYEVRKEPGFTIDLKKICSPENSEKKEEQSRLVHEDLVCKENLLDSQNEDVCSHSESEGDLPLCYVTEEKPGLMDEIQRIDLLNEATWIPSDSIHRNTSDKSSQIHESSEADLDLTREATEVSDPNHENTLDQSSLIYESTENDSNLTRETTEELPLSNHINALDQSLSGLIHETAEDKSDLTGEATELPDSNHKNALDQSSLIHGSTENESDLTKESSDSNCKNPFNQSSLIHKKQEFIETPERFNNKNKFYLTSEATEVSDLNHGNTLHQSSLIHVSTENDSNLTRESSDSNRENPFNQSCLIHESTKDQSDLAREATGEIPDSNPQNAFDESAKHETPERCNNKKNFYKRWIQIEGTDIEYDQASCYRKGSKVFDAIRKSGANDQETVVKFVTDFKMEDGKISKTVQREIDNHWETHIHDNVVTYYQSGVCKYKEKDAIFILMEKCDAKTLYERIKEENLPYIKRAKAVKCIAQGLQHLKENDIVHRNLKPQNILYRGKVDVISDFGLSKKISPNKSPTHRSLVFVGTAGWAAPEIYSDSTKSSFAADIYSAGLIFFFALTDGKHPYGDDPMSWQTFIKIDLNYNLKPLYDTPDGIVAYDLISLMLSRDPTNRPPIEGVLKHPFFWDVKKKNIFYSDICSIIEFHSEKKKESRIFSSQPVRYLKNVGTEIEDWKDKLLLTDAEENNIKENFKRRTSLDITVQKDVMKGFAKKLPDFVTSMVCFIRNRFEHKGEDKREKKIDLTDEELWEFFNSRYPYLFIYTYYASEEYYKTKPAGDPDNLEKYFGDVAKIDNFQ